MKHPQIISQAAAFLILFISSNSATGNEPDTFTSTSTDIEFIKISGGCFHMGSTLKKNSSNRSMKFV